LIPVKNLIKYSFNSGQTRGLGTDILFGANEMAIDPQTPVLVGVGQCVDHWDGANTAVAPDPSSLRLAAANAALEDCGARGEVLAAINRVIVVRTMLDSVEGAPQPFGRCSNPPGTLAAGLGIANVRLIYSVVGGDQPQALVNEAADAIFSGVADTILIAGAEATAALKAATRKRMKLDWSAGAVGPMEDRGLGSVLLSGYELANGLGSPTQTYPVFEHALRARLGLNREEHVALMSELWAGFSQVAAANPYAQFPTTRSAEFLATGSRENYAVADPYLKWHVAQDAVNQGAAVILSSVGRATAMGIDPAKFVYLHGYAKATDRLVTERADLSRSVAMEASLKLALAASGKTAADIAHFDLYSCFPCAVLLAAETLGLDWRHTKTTVTGGLPFFGGAGNNYSMHAIATLVERLRAKPAEFGLILANGGFLSKQAVGIYSATPKADWAPVSSATIQQAIDDAPAPALLAETTEAVIDTFTVTSSKGHPARGYVIASSPKGRILARVRTGHRATLTALQTDDPIGKSIRITHEKGFNFVEPSGKIGESGSGFMRRHFPDVLIERHGHVLEITLNRPDSMNALHSAAHFQLHEIWDDFARDPDLWIAIITGARDRAFCSGNDLKVTALGGDMTIPPSGFAGMCSRFDLEKPIIAAVSGIAMGGGMEIALACDLIVADESAKFALPEVKVGLFAAAGGVQRLTRQIGRKAAMELILTGKQISAAEAWDLGIINQCVPTGTALSAARALAETILANSPSAIRASKVALNQLDEIDSLKEALQANAPIIEKLFRTNDFREGVAAFAGKRKPEWTGT
jgi:acetyl-CoA C-acetyltransferase